MVTVPVDRRMSGFNVSTLKKPTQTQPFLAFVVLYLVIRWSLNDITYQKPLTAVCVSFKHAEYINCC